MPPFALYGLIAYGLVQSAKLGARVMATPAFVVLFILVCATQIVSHQLERFWHFEPHATISSYEINGFDPVLDQLNLNWVSLTVESTYERPYRPTYAACYIHGPVYYDPQQDSFISKLQVSQNPTAYYVGERMLVVKLIPVSMVTFDEYQPSAPNPAYGWQPPAPQKEPYAIAAGCP